MAWCPKCKNEYRKGITVCADCGCELVEEGTEKKQVPVIYGEEKQLNSLKKFLEYNDLEEVNIVFESSQHVHVLVVNEADQAKALKITKVFMEQRAREEMQRKVMTEAGMEDTEPMQETQEEERVSVPAGAYINSAQKAEDNRSSAWTLLLIGGIGLLIMILGITGFLPFTVGNPYLFYGVMSAVFILFIVMGFVSMKSARFFAQNAESENTLKNTLIEWCRANLKPEEIDAKIQDIVHMPEEELCLRRFDIIKYSINHQFMNLDQSFVDRLIDDEVYDMVFSSEE